MPYPQLLNLYNPPQLQIKGDLIFFQGNQVVYQKQMIREDSFYLVDRGIDLSLTQEILAFDDKYFWYMLRTKILKELEIVSPSVGLNILKQMPNLPQQTYLSIFRYLSLHKIKKIIMDNQFYSYLLSILIQFGNSEMQIQHQPTQLTLPSFADLHDLNQPHKRLLYIVEHVKSSLALDKEIQKIAYEVIFSKINQQNFLDLLHLGNKQNKNTLNGDNQKLLSDLLKNALKMICTLSLISKVPEELMIERKIKKQKLLIQFVLSDSFIATITVNFEYFLDFDRKNLTKLLSILVLQKQQKFWSEIIAKKYVKQNKIINKASQNNEGNGKLRFEETDNEDYFIQLMTNNFYQIGQPQWKASEGLIADVIKNSGSQAKFCLIKLFSEINTHFTTASVLQLVAMFIKRVCSPPEFDRSQIQFFLIQFLGNINVVVAEQYSKFQAKIKGKNRKEDTILINSYFKVYTLIIELNLYNILCGLDIRRSISQLMKITKDKKGLIEGTRRTFLKAKNNYLIQTRLLQNLDIGQKKKTRWSNRAKAVQKTKSEMQEWALFLKELD